ncbi:MAG: hypothetical protein ACK5Z2_19345 [Bacteroidota bacterium]|jgi:hypothetical protein
MRTIADIDQELTVAKKQLNISIAALEKHPDDFTYQMQLDRDEKHYQYLVSEKIKRQNARQKEIIQLHLEGPNVKRGTIPLAALADLSYTFSGSLTESALQLQYGKERVTCKERGFVNDQLNLCLERIEVGSTRLFVTGSTNPDLFGQSLMQQSISGMYDILETDNAEELLDKSLNSSKKALRETQKWLKTLSANRMECELIWDTTDLELRKWDGTLPRIGQMAQSLGQIQTTQTELVPMTGELITISLRGRGFIDLDSGEKQLVHINIANSQREELKQLHVGNSIRIQVRKTNVTNTVTRITRSRFDLEKIDNLSSKAN